MSVLDLGAQLDALALDPPSPSPLADRSVHSSRSYPGPTPFRSSSRPLNATAHSFVPTSASARSAIKHDTCMPVLPIELLYHIVSFITSHRTLVLLCAVNSAFLEIALPLVYRKLTIKQPLRLIELARPRESHRSLLLRAVHPRFSLDSVLTLSLHLPTSVASSFPSYPSLALPNLVHLELLFETRPRVYSPRKATSSACCLAGYSQLLRCLEPQHVTFSRSDGRLSDRLLVVPLSAPSLETTLVAWRRRLVSLTYRGVLLDPQHLHKSVSASWFAALETIEQEWDFEAMERREDVLMSVELIREGWLEAGRLNRVVLRAGDQVEWVERGWQDGSREVWEVEGWFEIVVR